MGMALTKENDPGKIRDGRSGSQKAGEETHSTIKSAHLGKFSLSA